MSRLPAFPYRQQWRLTMYTSVCVARRTLMRRMAWRRRQSPPRAEALREHRRRRLRLLEARGDLHPRRTQAERLTLSHLCGRLR